MKIKKILAIVVCVVLAITSISLPISASDAWGDDPSLYSYTLLGDGTISITGRLWIESMLKIPSKIDGYNVTQISAGAFYKERDLEIVEIPEGVTFIGERAFAYCDSLTRIYLPKSLVQTDKAAFMDCTSLSDVYYNSGESDWGEISFYDGYVNGVGIGYDRYLLNANIHYVTPCLKYGTDSLSFNQNIKGYIGDEIETLVVYTSVFQDIYALDITCSDTNVVEIGEVCLYMGDYVTSEYENKATIYLKLKAAGNATIKITSPEGLSVSVKVDIVSANTDGFNFHFNYPSNYLTVGQKVDLNVGYYANDILDTSTNKYIYTVSDSSVIEVSDHGFSEQYGQKLKITAKKEGSSTITVTNPNNKETSSLEIFVSASESGWNFYNIPEMIIESGKTTNFYNYSGMVVDEFAYTEHKNNLGVTDYYTVTMTVYNSVNLYGAVTSYKADGSVYEYSILDKMDSHESSFVDSLKSLYYNSGDLYYLIKNSRYYSGKSISTENKVKINVPVGGNISISNNIAISDMANLVNFLYLLFDSISVIKDSVDWVDSGTEIDKGIKDTVVSNVLTGILANKSITDKTLSCLKNSVTKEFEGLNLNYDNLIDAFVGVSEKLIKNVGFNIIEELENEICSVMGVASIGESIATKILPTGWIIDGLYTFTEGCDFAVFYNEYCKSIRRPGGIYIYAPFDSSEYQSNGIYIDTQDDMIETVVHAYTVADIGSVGIDKNTFADKSTYYSEKYQTHNITFYKNGTETQPNSPVTVRIPIPNNFNKLNRSALKVYRNNEDGTLTNMNAHVEGDYMVFETNHFSYYSVVDETPASISDDLKIKNAYLSFDDGACLNYEIEKVLVDNYYYTYMLLNNESSAILDYTENENSYIFKYKIPNDLLKDDIKAKLYTTNKTDILSSNDLMFNAYSIGKLVCDTTGDNNVDIRDLVKLKKYTAGIQTDDFNEKADPDSNGEINSLDLTFLLKFLLIF